LAKKTVGVNAMEIITNNVRKIMNNRQKIESALKIKISAKGRKLQVEGEQVGEFISIQFFEALDAGFPVKVALLLSNEEYLLEKVSIKNLTGRKNLSQIRARLIGKHGQTRELLEELSGCFIKVHDNCVYIIGRVEDIKKGINSVIKIIQGSKQSSVYTYLEKQRGIVHEDNLGLKDKF
jgi:rRNA processing protein Krr1/Pno1